MYMYFGNAKSSLCLFYNDLPLWLIINEISDLRKRALAIV